MEEPRRHSQAQEVSLVDGADAQARAEAANGLRQAETVIEMVMAAVERNSFKLRPSVVLELHRKAMEGLSAYAGNWRPADVEIAESEHAPPLAASVPSLVEDMCDYVNENWQSRSAIHLSSFVMWRLNWIHPFTDGNGRTSRAVSYLVLCARSAVLFPGTTTIPEQVVQNRKPYYSALEAADRKLVQHVQSGLDGFPEDVVSDMESLMQGMLAVQLRAVFDAASGAATSC